MFWQLCLRSAVISLSIFLSDLYCNWQPFLIYCALLLKISPDFIRVCFSVFHSCFGVISREEKNNAILLCCFRIGSYCLADLVIFDILISRYFNEGTVLAHYADVLGLLLRLRQICCHTYLLTNAVSSSGPSGR